MSFQLFNIEALLVMRTYALYERSRRILVFLLTLVAVGGLISGVSMVQSKTLDLLTKRFQQWAILTDPTDNMRTKYAFPGCDLSLSNEQYVLRRLSQAWLKSWFWPWSPGAIVIILIIDPYVPFCSYIMLQTLQVLGVRCCYSTPLCSFWHSRRRYELNTLGVVDCFIYCFAMVCVIISLWTVLGGYSYF